MTFELLDKIIKENNIPKSVTLLSDSGWECSETDMNGIYYNSDDNVIIFTQKGDSFEKYYDNKKWTLLHSAEENI